MSHFAITSITNFISRIDWERTLELGEHVSLDTKPKHRNRYGSLTYLGFRGEEERMDLQARGGPTWRKKFFQRLLPPTNW